ncbi:MAG: pentapeptide repeat-containing protein [Polyangiaceae bacterium]
MRARALTFVVLVVLGVAACDDDRRPKKGETVACGGGSVGLDAIAAGVPLCDTQHLVAPLDARRLDEKAGLGALSLPFRVTEVTPRDYCLTDDDSEGHTLALVDGSGKTVRELRAGGRCAPATLPVGDYALQLVHGRAGEEDLAPDVIHTKLERSSTRATLTFQSNTCRGCTLTGAWPCVGQGSTAYCGYVGDYAGARLFSGTCVAGEGTDCVLGGTFDGALVADNKIVAKRLVLGTPDGMAPRPSSFAGVDINTYNGFYPETLVLRGVTSLSGSLEPFFPKQLVNESPAAIVSWVIGLDAAKVPSFVGPALRADPGKNRDFRGMTLDLSRMVPFPPPVDGRVSYAGFSFARATLTGLRSFRAGTERIDMRNVDFSGATVTDCDFDVDSVEGATFAGATLTKVQFGAHALPSHEGVVASRMSFAGATLDAVTLGMDPPDPNAPGTPQLFDASELDATGAAVKHLVAKHTKLDDSTWSRATLATGSATGFSFVASDVSFGGASFRDVAAFERVVWRGCALDESPSRPGKVFELSLLGAVASLSGWNLDGSRVRVDKIAPVTFDRCSFVGATLSGNLGLRAFEGCSFRGARFTSGSSLARATLRACDFSEADLDGADLGSVVATSTPFVRASFSGATVMGGAVFTDGSFDGARFCDGASPAGAAFERVSLRGAVVPAAEEPPYQESPTELVCRGTIPLAQRRVLGTDRVTACPDGVAGPCGGAANDARWTPVRGQSRPVCCTPSPSAPTCVRHVKNAPCTSPCDCASLTCIAGKCG